MANSEQAISFDPTAQIADLTSLGLSHDSTRERVRLLEAVVENFPGGIALFDKDMLMVLCNQRLKDMLQYPEALFADGFPNLEQVPNALTRAGLFAEARV